IGVLVLYYDKLRSCEVTELDLEFLKGVGSRIAITLAKIHKHKQIEVLAIQQTKLGNLALLSASITHALRTPLTIIRGNLELAAGETDQALLRRYIDQANRAVDRGQDMIRRLVSWATPAGMTSARFHYADIVKDIRQLMADMLSEKHIEWVEHVDATAPQVYAPPDGIR